MSDKRRPSIVESGSLSLGARASFEAIWVVTHGHTGRKVVGDQDYVDAEAWMKAIAAEDPRAAESSGRFSKYLRQAGVVTSGSLACYRGRWDDGTVQDWNQMGPPPAECAEDNRYSTKGQVMLYLATSEAGVWREMAPRGQGTLFIQEYVIRSNEVRLLDLTSDDLDPFIISAMALAEQAKVPGRSGLDTYVFGQVIASLVANAGYGGMLVPGVLGDSNVQYRNVIIFSPADRWRDWSTGAQGFRVLPPQEGGSNIAR